MIIKFSSTFARMNANYQFGIQIHTEFHVHVVLAKILRAKLRLGYTFHSHSLANLLHFIHSASCPLRSVPATGGVTMPLPSSRVNLLRFRVVRYLSRLDDRERYDIGTARC